MCNKYAIQTLQLHSMRAEIQSQSFISSLPAKLYQAKTKVIQEFRKIKDIELKEISNKIFKDKSHYIYMHLLNRNTLIDLEPTKYYSYLCKDKLILNNQTP